MENANKNKVMITAFSLSVSVLLVIVKVVIAYLSNSIGVFSEALNNGLDLVTVLIAFMAIRIAIRPPDSDHTYGHGKYENLSAAIELIIITGLCLYIIYRSITRIIYRDFQLHLNNYVFIVLIVSVVLNIIRVYILGRAARRYRSSIFEAEYLNYMSDIAGSIIVILGLVFARRGYILADPIASVTVAVAVLFFAVRLSLKVFRNLLDYIPEEVTSAIKDRLSSVDGVKKVNALRVHEVGNIKFININAGIDENIYLSRAEKIKADIREKIIEKFPGSKIIVELKAQFSDDNMVSKVKEIILENLDIEDIHNVSCYRIGDQVDISVHVILKGHKRLLEVEILTRKVEKQLKDKIPSLRGIYIHIEEDVEMKSYTDITSVSEELIEKIKKLVSGYIDPDLCHNFTILKCSDRYNVAFHCNLSPRMKVEKAHDISTAMESIIRENIENIGDLAIHVEPS